MADSIRQRIFDEVVRNLRAIPGDARFKRAMKLQSVQTYRHLRRDEDNFGNTQVEETILVRSGSQSVGPGECGNLLKELQVEMKWVLIGESVTEEDINEAEHDLELALWTEEDDLAHLRRGPLRAEVDVLMPDLEHDVDAVFYTLFVPFSSALGDPTERGL
jgi:hypothetical protein